MQIWSYLPYVACNVQQKPSAKHPSVRQSVPLYPKYTLTPVLTQDLFPTMSFERSMERVSLCCWYDKYRVELWERSIKVSQSTTDKTVYIQDHQSALKMPSAWSHVAKAVGYTVRLMLSYSPCRMWKQTAEMWYFIRESLVYLSVFKGQEVSSCLNDLCKSHPFGKEMSVLHPFKHKTYHNHHAVVIYLAVYLSIFP